MKDKRHRAVLVVITTTLALALSPLPAFSAPQNTPVYLPSCGADPGANTRSWQQTNDAAPGSTLILPPGVCVVAK